MLYPPTILSSDTTTPQQIHPFCDNIHSMPLALLLVSPLLSLKWILFTNQPSTFSLHKHAFDAHAHNSVPTVAQQRNQCRIPTHVEIPCPTNAKSQTNESQINNEKVFWNRCVFISPLPLFLTFVQAHGKRNPKVWLCSTRSASDHGRSRGPRCFWTFLACFWLAFTTYASVPWIITSPLPFCCHPVSHPNQQTQHLPTTTPDSQSTSPPAGFF